MEPSCIAFTFPIRILCRDVSIFVAGCPCGDLGRGPTSCPPYVGPFLGKSIPNKLGCNSIGWSKVFSISYNYILRVTIDI